MRFVINRNIEILGASKSERAKIKELLSFDNPQWLSAVQFGRSTYGIRRKITLFEDKEGAIVVPRGSLYRMIDEFGLPDSIVDNTASFDKMEVDSHIELRPMQVPWVEQMLKHRTGIGVAPAGSGKTVMGLQIIATLGQPTLWLTHRKTLLRQFIERAGLFLCETDIGIIGGGKEKLGRLLTVGMVQTISRKDMSAYQDKFGLVIVDEAHIVPTMQTSQSIRKFAPKYIYGLTATPYREDGLERIMFDTIGPVIADMERREVVKGKNIMPAIINVRTTGIRYNKDYNMQASFGKIIDYLSKHEERNMMIATDVLAEVALGNICIVLTSRIEHGQTLKNIMEVFGIKCSHSHSKQTDKQRHLQMEMFLSGKAPVMVATYQLLGEGFDHQPTSRIFFALPYKARALIEQSKGRIERVFEGKKDAVVYDYVDDIPMLRRQFQQRMEYYKGHNLEVVFNRLI